MNWLQTVRMALKSIATNKVRSLLTMLGIIIGVAAVITLVASIQSKATLTRMQYEAMGLNRIQVSGSGAKRQDWANLEDYMNGELAPYISGWSPQSQYYDWESKGVQYRTMKLKSDKSTTYMYYGNEDYGKVTNSVITAGRDISKTDCDNQARVCVIGETIRKYFFGAMSPIGQKIRIGGKSFEVIGVYKGKYKGKLNTEDQMLVMPYTLQSSMMSTDYNADKQYIIQATSKNDIQKVVDALNARMKPICEAGKGWFDASSASQFQEQEEAAAQQDALLMGGVAMISLLVGGIGIMNIMLVSVTERTREIGIRMAIGARRRDIISQFLIEAASVSCCGGIIGIIIGCFGSAIMGNFMLAKQLSEQMWMPDVEKFTVLPSPPLILGAFLFSALLGIIFGIYPANKASKLQPVDALRTQ
ncbi:MAG: ABC transporter permease [Butyricicoccus sp.]|nr:ABC transporter permease [Butyricicoccus sp.]